MAKLVRCGDTAWCSKCDKNVQTSIKELAYLVENELGRCDYYSGPGMKTRMLESHTVSYDNSSMRH